MAHRYHRRGSTRYHTPITLDELRPYTGRATARQTHEYQQKVGSVLFPAIITRPDAARATNKLAEFLTNRSPQHLDRLTEGSGASIKRAILRLHTNLVEMNQPSRLLVMHHMETIQTDTVVLGILRSFSVDQSIGRHQNRRR